jgi:hypothetical protein
VVDEQRKRKAWRSSHDNKSKNNKQKKATKTEITTTARSVESIGIKFKSVTRTKTAKSIRIAGKTPPNPNTQAVVTPSPSKVKVECLICKKVVTTYSCQSQDPLLLTALTSDSRVPIKKTVESTEEHCVNTVDSSLSLRLKYIEAIR